MKKLTISLLALILTISAVAQIRLQAVHNAADPSLAMVDVYFVGILGLDDFAYKTATPFIENFIGIGAIPAGVPINIGVAPSNSTSVADTFYSFTMSFAANTNYVLVANGVKNIGNFDQSANGANIAVDIYPINNAVHVGAQDSVKFALFHGATDAPTIDGTIRAYGNSLPIFSNLDYATYATFGPSAYGVVPAMFGSVALDIKTSLGGVDLGTFILPFDGLTGQAGVILTSGFVNPALNQNGEEFGLYFVPSTGGLSIPFLQMEKPGIARMQFINNSPDPLADALDVYINSTQRTSTLNDLSFRGASEYFDVETGYNTIISINGDTSSNSDDAILKQFFYPAGDIDVDSTFVVFIDGLLDTNLATNPHGISSELTIIGNPGGESGSSNQTSGFADILFHQGIIDAPFVSLDLITGGSSVGMVLDTAYYTQSAIVPNLPTTNYYVDFSQTLNASLYGRYYLGLEPASTAPTGVNLVVFASGLMGTPDYGLYGAVTDGTVFPLALVGESKLQFIHNSADPETKVDFYFVDGTGELHNKLDNYAFRNASNFFNLPSGVDINVIVADTTSTGPTDQVYDVFPVSDPDNDIYSAGLWNDENYVVMVKGVVDTTAFTANPDGENIGIGLATYKGAKLSATTGTTEALIYNGVTDVPAIDVEGTVQLAGNVVYGEYNPIGYVLAPTVADANVDVEESVSSNLINTYTIPLSDWSGQAMVIFASGFMDDNQGESFGVFAADTAGNVTELDVFVGVDEIASLDNITLYPNPADDNIRLDYTLVNNANVKLTVFNSLGQMVNSINRGLVPAGRNYTDFDVRELNSGIYMLQVQIGDQSLAKTFYVK